MLSHLLRPNFMTCFAPDEGFGGGGSGDADSQTPPANNPQSGGSPSDSKTDDWQKLAKIWQSRHDTVVQQFSSLKALHDTTEKSLAGLSAERDDWKTKHESLSGEKTKYESDLAELQRKHIRLTMLVAKYPQLMSFQDEVMLFPEEGEAFEKRLQTFAEKVKGVTPPPQNNLNGVVPPPPANNAQTQGDPTDPQEILKVARKALVEHKSDEYKRLMDLYYKSLK